MSTGKDITECDVGRIEKLIERISALGTDILLKSQKLHASDVPDTAKGDQEEPRDVGGRIIKDLDVICQKLSDSYSSLSAFIT